MEQLTATTPGTEVLAFELGEERYCVDIENVADIVDVGSLTRLPNAPRGVESR